MNPVGIILILSLIFGLAETVTKLKQPKKGDFGWKRSVFPSPCRRRHHRTNTTIGGKDGWKKPRGPNKHKGLFGDGTPARLSAMIGVFFTDSFYVTRGTFWKHSLSTYYLDRKGAAAACHNMGAQLARISSQDEFNHISKWLETLSPYDRQQIHIDGVHEKNDWVYDKNSLGPFLVWHSDEPSSVEPGSWQESCLVMERRSGQFKMNDMECSNVWRRFLCEEQV